MITIIIWDITDQNTQAIVNPANPLLAPWWWVSWAIHKKAWLGFTVMCKQYLKDHDIAMIDTWQAIITPWWLLDNEYVIHVVWPQFRLYPNNRKELLAKSYIACLDLCVQHHIKSISFPSIATGIYGCPVTEASKVAVEVIRDYLDKHIQIEEVRFVLYNQSDYNIYAELLS